MPPRAPARPATTSAATTPKQLGPAIYCVGGPWDGQGFTEQDWKTRLDDARHRRAAHGMESNVEFYRTAPAKPPGAPTTITTSGGQWQPLTYKEWTR